MARPEPPVRWAPRLRPERLRRLYTADARGLVDEDLIDDVGFALYSRCRSILTVSRAMHGEVECPQCDTVIRRERLDADYPLACPQCGWATTWSEYHRTFQHQELYGGGAVDIFRWYVEQWERAATPQQKMSLIDRLIHAWHWEARQDHILGRPTGVNLIEGNRQQVLAVLDGLTYGAGSSPGLAETRAAWRETWGRVQAASKANREE